MQKLIKQSKLSYLDSKFVSDHGTLRLEHGLLHDGGDCLGDGAALLHPAAPACPAHKHWGPDSAATPATSPSSSMSTPTASTTIIVCSCRTNSNPDLGESISVIEEKM